MMCVWKSGPIFTNTFGGNGSFTNLYICIYLINAKIRFIHKSHETSEKLKDDDDDQGTCSAPTSSSRETSATTNSNNNDGNKLDPLDKHISPWQEQQFAKWDVHDLSLDNRFCDVDGYLKFFN